MYTESKGSRASDGPGLERAIVLQLLRDDREHMWSRTELERELEAGRAEVGQEAVAQALRRLAGKGVLGMSEEAAWASNAVRALDELGLISV